MTEEASIRDTLSRVFWEEMDRVHTYFPGEIVSVRDSGLVDIKPNVKFRFFGDTVDTDMPIINNCVLIQTRSESSIIRQPKEGLKGSKVGVFVSEHSLEEWRESGGDSVMPIEGRRYNINDATAILGMYPETVNYPVDQLPNTLEVRFNEGNKGYFGNDAGDDIFDLLYQLIEIVEQPDSNGDTFPGVSTKGNLIGQVKVALSKIANTT